MNTDLRRIGRRFPDYGWAWPTGSLDQLLKAVISPDDERALGAGLDWLSRNDIDVAGFREHRLLAALSDRFGKRLAPSPAHPRLMGLQRMMWSRSRMALRDSRPALAALADAQVPFILIKGASRIALDPGAQRARASHDIDILVRPGDMPRSFEILIDCGWQASTGAGRLRLKTNAAMYRAMNFFSGEFGDVDVHQAAYQTPNFDAEDEAALWRRSVAVSLDGVPARVPAASDRIALAIAHGALDAHAHSDWMVDAAGTIMQGGIDWDALMATIVRRRIVVPAASVMTYLAQEIGIPVPPDFLLDLVNAADASGPAARLTILECKPRDDLGGVSAVARGIVKQMRLRRGRDFLAPSVGPLWRTRRAGRADDASCAIQHTIPVPSGTNRRANVEIAVILALPPSRRRVELELSTPTRHIALLRYRKLHAYSGTRKLVFKGVVELQDGEDQLVLSSCASRFVHHTREAAFAERYGALPFALKSASFN